MQQNAAELSEKFVCDAQQKHRILSVKTSAKRGPRPPVNERITMQGRPAGRGVFLFVPALQINPPGYCGCYAKPGRKKVI